jgi:hypothetical protein
MLKRTRQMLSRQMRLVLAAGVSLAIDASVSLADSHNAAAQSPDPTFGSRTDNRDGSAAMTIGRRLPIAWDTKIGTDVSLAAPADSVTSDYFKRGSAPDQSSGAIWGSLTMPGVRPLGFDRTSVDARIDAGKDEGKLGATLSRSLPIDPNLSLTLQHSHSVTQSLANGASMAGGPSTISITPPATAPATPLPAQTWSTDESIRLTVSPTGTTFLAGATASTTGPQWHNKFGIEQTLFGPLKVTTSVEDAGSPASQKSITAGFKRVW